MGCVKVMLNSINQPLATMVAGALAALVVIIGWYVTHQSNKRREDLGRRREAQRRFVERQLEELYGPLHGLIVQCEILSHLALNTVRDAGGASDGLTNVSSTITRDEVVPYRRWRFYVDQFILPTYREIVTLLRQHIHLVHMMGTSQPPDSFNTFLKHAASFELFERLRTDQDNVPGRAREVATAWPAAFKPDVERHLQALRNEYHRLTTD